MGRPIKVLKYQEDLIDGQLLPKLFPHLFISLLFTDKETTVGGRNLSQGMSYSTEQDKCFTRNRNAEGATIKYSTPAGDTSIESDMFSCFVCDKKFKQKRYIGDHMRRMHGLKKCFYCLNFFPLGSEFDNHVRSCDRSVVEPAHS